MLLAFDAVSTVADIPRDADEINRELKQEGPAM